jgi:NAD(P)-dependent dehydrogenase (short-subunit alcohol dehydrogenase family)
VRRAPHVVTLEQDASYLVVGGMTGIGRSICQWMVDHGAKNLIILSRSARRDSLVGQLEKSGCKVLCLPCNVASENDLAYALEQGRACMPQIKGVVQGAMVLKVIILSDAHSRSYRN